ncbi:MAG: DUF1801 domain-containing protein [Acidimicrobiales bacterium]
MDEVVGIADADVAAVYASFDDAVRSALLELRRLVLETADATHGVGAVEEALRWGQPAFLTTETRSGSTIRLAPTGPDSAADCAMYFICNTNLVDSFRALFGSTFSYDGNRALLFSVGDELPEDELRECVAMALTYHLTKA